MLQNWEEQTANEQLFGAFVGLVVIVVGAVLFRDVQLAGSITMAFGGVILGYAAAKYRVIKHGSSVLTRGEVQEA